MKIPQELWDQYQIHDPEADILFKEFDEPEGSQILEVGSQHAPIASILAKCEFNVHGVDLRDCDQEPNYTHIKNNFCTLPLDLHRQFLGKFDAAIAISAIEHFGLNTYGEGSAHTRVLYDAVAMQCGIHDEVVRQVPSQTL